MIRSNSEPCVVVRAATGKSANGPWGSVQLRPVRDKDGLSTPVDFRWPPSKVEELTEGQVVNCVFETLITVFARTARTETNLVDLKAAA